MCTPHNRGHQGPRTQCSPNRQHAQPPPAVHRGARAGRRASFAAGTKLPHFCLGGGGLGAVGGGPANPKCGVGNSSPGASPGRACGRGPAACRCTRGPKARNKGGSWGATAGRCSKRPKCGKAPNARAWCGPRWWVWRNSKWHWPPIVVAPHYTRLPLWLPPTTTPPWLQPTATVPHCHCAPLPLPRHRCAPLPPWPTAVCMVCTHLQCKPQWASPLTRLHAVWRYPTLAHCVARCPTQFS